MTPTPKTQIKTAQVGTALRAVRAPAIRKNQEGARDGAGPGDGRPGDGRLGEASLPESRPHRQWLGHAVPSWVDHGIFFVTINCQNRNGNDLITEKASDVIKTAALHHHGSRWWMHLWVTMPDHIHALLSFPMTESMVKVVSDWKRFVARKAGIEWQKGFFDHRLRHDESFDEKAHYIRMNPVRKGLCQSPEDWPHMLSFDGRDGSPSRPQAR